MVGKSDEVQEHTKRLRFKSLTSIHQASGDASIDRNVKEFKQKGNKTYIFRTFSLTIYISRYLYFLN